MTLGDRGKNSLNVLANGFENWMNVCLNIHKHKWICINEYVKAVDATDVGLGACSWVCVCPASMALKWYAKKHLHILDTELT